MVFLHLKSVSGYLLIDSEVRAWPHRAAKRQPSGKSSKSRGLPVDGEQAVRSGSSGARNCNQRLSIRVGRIVEQTTDIGALHDAAGIHDGDPIAHPGHNAKVVGDENYRQPSLLLNILEQSSNIGAGW